MKWLDSISDSVDMNLRKLREIWKDTGAWQFTGVTESTRLRRLNNNNSYN